MQKQIVTPQGKFNGVKLDMQSTNELLKNAHARFVSKPSEFDVSKQ